MLMLALTPLRLDSQRIAEGATFTCTAAQAATLTAKGWARLADGADPNAADPAPTAVPRFLRGADGGVVQLYAGLDKTVPGTALDATQAPVLKGQIDALAASISKRITVSASRPLAPADIGATLLCNSASPIVLTVPTGFGAAGDSIVAAAVGNGSVSWTQQSGAIGDPYITPPAAAGGLTAVICTAPGQWSVVA